jgi:hypothetical protein
VRAALGVLGGETCTRITESRNAVIFIRAVPALISAPLGNVVTLPCPAAMGPMDFHSAHAGSVMASRRRMPPAIPLVKLKNRNRILRIAPPTKVQERMAEEWRVSNTSGCHLLCF